MSRQEQLIAGFRDVLNKMRWLNGQEMKTVFAGYNASEIHGIEYIGDHPDVNVTRLAEAFYQTRGGISKITKKLMEKGVIQSYQKPDNKKEVYFRLTPQGEAIHRTHAKLHSAFQARDKAVFEQLTEAESDTILAFIQSYSQHLDALMGKQ